MKIRAGDYRLWVARPCRRKYITILRELHRQGLAGLFETGLDGLIGDLSAGELPARLAFFEPPDIYSTTIQHVRLHLAVDSRRLVVRIVRVMDLDSPLPPPVTRLPGGSAGS